MGTRTAVRAERLVWYNGDWLGWEGGIPIVAPLLLVILHYLLQTTKKKRKKSPEHLTSDSFLIASYLPLLGSVSVAIWFIICRRVCKSIVQISASFLPEGTTGVFARAAGAVVKQFQTWRMAGKVEVI